MHAPRLRRAPPDGHSPASPPISEPQLEFSSDPVFYVVGTIAVIIVGLGKGGFTGLGLLSTPLLALYLPPVQAAAVMMPILVVQDVLSVWVFRKSFDKRSTVIIVTGGLAGVAVGWVLASAVPEAFVRLTMGLVAVVFVLLYWKRRHGTAEHGKPAGIPGGLFWGAVAGYTSFVAHAGAPPVQVYLMPQRLPPQIYAGTSTMFFAAVNAFKFVAYIHLGQFTPTNIGLSAVMLPIAVASTFAGVWLVRRVDAARFYDLIYGLTLLIGLKLAYDGIVELL